MKYSLCQFEYGYEGQFYQICDLNSEIGFVRFSDLDGNTLELVPPYGYYIVDGDSPTPTWDLNND
jgi:hypothetical protein